VLAKGDTVTMSLSKFEFEDMVGRPLNVLLEQEVARREAHRARRAIKMAWDELDIGLSTPHLLTSAPTLSAQCPLMRMRHAASGLDKRLGERGPTLDHPSSATTSYALHSSSFCAHR
jgi:hypothetical protein